MNLSQIRDAVIEETGRADKSTMILRAVRSIVLKSHQADYFPKDRVSANAIYPSSPANDVILALPTRWRKFSTIERLDGSTGVALGDKFSSIDPDDSLQFDGSRVPYHYWVEGTNIKIYSRDVITRIGWVYYVNPDIASDTASTWVTNTYEQELIDGACAYVYRKLGDRTTAEMYMIDWRDFLGKLIQENLLSEL